ncbi:MAG: DUF3536 domain-containing protein, partial [Armatimonadetes bacterium]|nr:DUF3536 domain-containing protein [Armatimonadota bacterium]
VYSKLLYANAFSRVLDPAGKIDDIVNNFEYINFNIGPTLFEWLKRRHPKTYDRIITADWRSRGRNNGHGNAIAQVYSHIIMPLANRRDKVTQVKWALADFRHRFSREAEAIWLAETAVNDETLEVLIANNIKYVILSPVQALKIRDFDQAEWTTVHDGSIDTTKPYRWFLKDKKGASIKEKYIDIFFFNREIANEMSFNHLLTNADVFASSLLQEASKVDEDRPILINVATDGETFGHHKPFADMCLAYFFKESAPMQEFTITNYANFLEMFPPATEVELKSGHNNEGTSWSCAHGVGRWYRDCGCKTGVPAWYNQQWRKPLRLAFDYLREESAKIFEAELGKLMRNVWYGRDEYINVILDRSDESVDAFFKKFQLRQIEPEEKTTLLKLFESQRFEQLMYTSCGWFYGELSGIETVQNIKYAAKLIELLQRYDGSIRENFLRIMKTAKSNIAYYDNGQKVYELLVEPAIFDHDKMASSYAITEIATGHPEKSLTPNYDVEKLDEQVFHGQNESITGLLKIIDNITKDSRLFTYYVKAISLSDVVCYLKKVADEKEHHKFLEKFKYVSEVNLPDVFESRQYTWNDFLPQLAAEVMRELILKRLGNIYKHFAEMFNENSDLFKAYVETGVQLPEEVKALIKFHLGNLLSFELKKNRLNLSESSLANAYEVLEQAKIFQVDLDTFEIGNLFTEDILAEAHWLKEDLSLERLKKIGESVEICDKLKIFIRKDLIENVLIEVIEEKIVPKILFLKEPDRDMDDYRLIVQALDYLERLNFSKRKYVELLRDFRSKIQE